MAGSNKRKRNKGYFVRYDDNEDSEILGKAQNANLEPASFIRQASLDAPAPRAKRRPHPDEKLLRQVLGQCAKIGTNLNQIAYQLNSKGEPDIPELMAALPIYSQIRTAIYTALNMNPADDNKRQ